MQPNPQYSPNPDVQDVISVEAATSVRHAARRMVDEHVGTLIVTQEGSPIGIVTDRDLALGVLRNGWDPDSTPILECTSTPLITIPAQAALDEASAHMAEHRVRRIARVDDDGNVIGVVSVDDIVAVLGKRWSQLARMIARERRQEPENFEAKPPIYGSE